MQGAAFETLGLPHLYLPFEVHPEHLRKAVEAIIPLGLQGLNLTIPHKESVMPFLDKIDSEAEKMGAVNTIEVCSGALIGHNTDGRGFLASLLETGVNPAGMKVLLLGAGGAARGVAVALLSAGVSEMVIMARNKVRAGALAKNLKAISPKVAISVKPFSFEKGQALRKKHPTLLINSTPLGMKASDPLPFSAREIQSDWVVADLIYRPYETPLLLAAKKNGAKIVPGLGMLLHQGALAFEIWTKMKAPLEPMRKSLRLAFEDQGLS